MSGPWPSPLGILMSAYAESKQNTTKELLRDQVNLKLETQHPLEATGGQSHGLTALALTLIADPPTV